MASKSSDDLSLLLVAKLDPKASEDVIREQLDALKATFAKTNIEVKVKINEESLKALTEMKNALREIVTLQGRVDSGGARYTVRTRGQQGGTDPDSMGFNQRLNALAAFQTTEFGFLESGYEKTKKLRQNYLSWWKSHSSDKVEASVLESEVGNLNSQISESESRLANSKAKLDSWMGRLNAELSEWKKQYDEIEAQRDQALLNGDPNREELNRKRLEHYDKNTEINTNAQPERNAIGAEISKNNAELEALLTQRNEAQRAFDETHYNQELSSFDQEVALTKQRNAELEKQQANEDKIYNKELSAHKKYAEEALQQKAESQLQEGENLKDYIERVSQYQDSDVANITDTNERKKKSDLDYANWWTTQLDKREQTAEADLTKREKLAQQDLQRTEADNEKMKKERLEYVQFWEKSLQNEDTLTMQDSERRAKESQQGQAAQAKKVQQAQKEANAAASEAKKEYENSFAGKFSKNLDMIAMWTSVTSLVFGSIHAIKDGFAQITEIDTAMTDLKKVTDESSASYDNFARKANAMAHNLGSSTVEIIKATAEFSRLGYTLDQASGLAGAANLYSNVGGMDVQTASSAIISTVKGFGVQLDAEQKNVTHIVDAYNEVGNHFAISSAGLGDAVKRSASSLSEAGNSMEQTIGMITAANATVQDPEAVGTALKTIAMRLRGVDEAGDPIIGMTAKLEGNFSKIGLSLMKDNNTFKSTYEIMQDLSKVWGTLTDIQKADMLEQVAGKRQGNVVAGMLNNWQDAEKSMNAAMNSTGSAAKENATYMDSIEAKQKQAANAVTEFWQSALDSGAVKLGLTAFTGLIKVITAVTDVFGGLPSILGAATFAMTAYAVVTGTTDALMAGQTGVVGILGNAYVALAGKVEAAGGIMAIVNGLFAASVVGAIVAVLAAGLGYLTKLAIDAFQAHDKLVKKLGEEVQASQKTEAVVSKLANEYDTLSKKTNLTNTEKERLVSIQAEMAQQMPQLIEGYDSEGKAIYASAEETRKFVAEMKKANAERVYALALEKSKDAPKNEKIIQDGAKAISEGNAEIAQGRAKLEALKIAQELSNTLDPANSDYQEKIDAGFAKIKEIYKAHGVDVALALNDIPMEYLDVLKGQFGDILLTTEQGLAASQTKVRDAVEKTKGAVDEQKSILAGMTSPTELLLKDAGPNFDKVRDAILGGVTDVSNQSGIKFADMAQKWKTDYSNFIFIANTKKIDFKKLYDSGDAIANLKSLEQAMLDAQYAPEVVAVAMRRLRGDIQSTSTTTYDLKSGMSKFVSELDTQGKNIDLLAKAYQQLQRGQHLSLEEVHKLILAHPELAKEVKNINGQLGLEAEALAAAGLAAGKSAQDVVLGEQAKAEAIAKTLQTAIDATAKMLELDMTVVKAKGALNALFAGNNSASIGSAMASAEGQRLMEQDFQLENTKIAIERLKEAAKATDPAAMWKTAVSDAVDHNHDPVTKEKKAAEDKHDPFYVNYWEHNITALQLELTKLEMAKKKYTETDKEFLDLQRQEIDINKRIQSQYAEEAGNIRGSIIPALDAQMAQYAVHSKEWDQLAQKRDEQVKKTESLSQSWWGIESKVQDVLGGSAKKDDWLKNVTKELADRGKIFDEQINQSQARQAALDKNSTGYRDELHAQNEILKERIAYEGWIVKLLKDEQAQLEQRMKTENMTGSVLQAVKARLIEVKGIVADTTKNMSTQNETIAKNSNEWWDSMKAWRKQAEQLADKIVSYYKDVQKAIHDAQLASLEDVKKAEDDRHNDVIKNMDEESKKFEQVISDKIKLMDREWQNKQDKKNLDKEQENRAKLQTQIDKLALDNSVEGRAKVADLQTKLKEQDDKLQDMRDKKTHDERKDNLQTELDQFKRNKDTEKNTENTRHDQEVKHFEELKKQYDDQYDKAVNNEEKIQKLRQAVFDGDMNYVNEQLTTYFGAFDNLADATMRGIGQKIRDNLDLAQKLQDTLDSVNGTNGQTALPAPPGTDDNNTQGKSGSAITDQSGTVNNDGLRKVQAYEEIVSNKINAAAYYKESGSWDDPRIKGLASRNSKLRADFGIGDFTSEEAQTQWDTVKDGGWDRYVKNKRKWWLLYKEVGGTSSPLQLELAQDNERLRRMFGFADISHDDLKLMGELPFDRNERDKALQTMIANKLEWKKDRSNLDAITDPQEKAKIQEEMARLANDNKAIRGKHDDIHDYSDAELRKLNVDGFSLGGFTGNWSGSGGRVIAVHPEEFVLNKADTKNILAAAHVMRDLFNSPSLFQKQSAPAPAGVTIGTISLTIERLNGDEQGGKTVFKTIIDELNRTKGVRI